MTPYSFTRSQWFITKTSKFIHTKKYIQTHAALLLWIGKIRTCEIYTKGQTPLLLNVESHVKTKHNSWIYRPSFHISSQIISNYMNVNINISKQGTKVPYNIRCWTWYKWAKSYNRVIGQSKGNRQSAHANTLTVIYFQYTSRWCDNRRVNPLC